MEEMKLFNKNKFKIGDKVKLCDSNALYEDYRDLPLIIKGIVKAGEVDYDLSMAGETLYKFKNIPQTFYENELRSYDSDE